MVSMFFEGANGTFGGIDAMVVRWDQLNLHLVLFDVFLNSLGAFVIHEVEHRLVLPRLQNVEDFCEGGNEGCVNAFWHWADDDGVKVIHVCDKNVLHVLERSNRKRSSDICVHGAGRGVGKGGEAKHVVHCTCFVDGEHVVNLGTWDSVGVMALHILPLSVAVDLGKWA